jgi:hypothetical protein
MTEPVVYVSTWKIKEGKFDAYARFHERLANTVRDLEPRVAAFLAFANDDGTDRHPCLFGRRRTGSAHWRPRRTDPATSTSMARDPGRLWRWTDHCKTPACPSRSRHRFVGGFTRGRDE